MGFYKYLGKIWKNPIKNNREEYKAQIRKWRKENSIVRAEKPTRLDKARGYGYKAKKGFVTLRARIKKGGRKRERVHSGRKPSKSGQAKYSTKKSLQLIAEERVQRRYPNLALIGSYWVGADGQYKYFEVVAVDPLHPQIRNSKQLKWTLFKRKHALRTQTSQGKKLRGLV